MNAPITCALLSGLLCAQQLPDDQIPVNASDWRMPFRQPSKPIEAPPDGPIALLKTMQRIAANAGSATLRIGEHGAEVCDDPEWQATWERVRGERMLAGTLSLVIRESGAIGDRAAAFYGAFYEPDPRMVCSLIEHIPGEPARQLREEALRRAATWARANLGRRNPGDLAEWQAIRVGPAGTRPPRPGDYACAIDPLPFLALLVRGDDLDRAQVLWFAAEASRARPDFGRALLELAGDRIHALIGGDHAQTVAQAGALLAVLDPERREPPAADADTDRRVAWCDAVLRSVLPPIRHVSRGLVALYPSADLEELVAVGTRGLRDGTLGEPASGNDKDGTFYRGFRIDALPAPLDQLGFELHDVVVAVDGVPVATGAEVLAAVGGAAAKRSLIVELVHHEQRRAREFRVLR